MNRVNLVEMFGTPHIPLQDNELKTDSEHPNLNSKEYRKKSVDLTAKILNKFDGFAVNSENNAVISSNNYTGRIWSGSIWGFEDVEDIKLVDNNSVYRLKCDSPVTNIIYVEKNIILFSESSGALQLWSTHSEVRKPIGYCLYSLGNNTEHTGLITGIDIFKTEKTKALSVSSDFCIKLWDIGCDLTSINTMRNAHFGNITGVSSSYDSNSLFVTCARDKSALLWDNRLSRPASGIFEDHNCAFTTIYWTAQTEYNNLIMIGDESGQVHAIDVRKPKEMLETIKIFEKPIRKIKFNGNCYAVCGNTNKVVVYNTNHENIYSNSSYMNFVRDICWITSNSNKTFYTVDWDAQMQKHVLQ